MRHYSDVLDAIRLEPLSAAHLEDCARLTTDPEVGRFTRVPDAPPEDFAIGWVDRYVVGRRDGSCEGFAAFDGDGRFIGLALAPRIDHEAREMELGYIVAASERGRGAASAMLELLTAWAFHELGALRLQLLIDVDNVPSKRVASRCGYLREGTMRSVHVKPGVRRDVELWSRLRSDPDPTTG